MFIEHQINVLQWFLKNNVTPKADVRMLKIQLCIIEKKYIYILIEKVILNGSNISQYYSFFTVIWVK